MIDEIMPEWMFRLILPIYRWQSKRKVQKNLIQKFGKTPEVGDTVCDCRYHHVQIAKFLDEDTILTSEGFGCSLWNCCSPVPHEWEHPEEFSTPTDLPGYQWEDQ